VKRIIIWLPLVIIFAAVVGLQGQGLPPFDQRAEDQRRETERKIAAERDRRNTSEFDTSMKTFRPPERTVVAGPTIDKETSERIRLARKVDAADYFPYSEFLKAEKTGVFKLFPDYDCVVKNVIRIDGDCKNFVMASSSFSFRNLGYAHPYYSDLGFDQGEIFSNAFFSQGIIVSLGDVPIEDVTPSRDGLKFLFDLPPASEPGEARKVAVKFKAGLENGGFKYSTSLKPAENTTYALRSIAYNVANSLPAVTEMTSLNEMRFHTLSLDKRADVIIVFRIIRKGTDGSLTIVWKELDRREAPKIKFSKGEKFVDFKPEIVH